MPVMLTTAVFQNLKTPLAVVVVDKHDDCHFNLANNAFSRLVGFPRDVLEGLPPNRLSRNGAAARFAPTTSTISLVKRCRATIRFGCC